MMRRSWFVAVMILMTGFAAACGDNNEQPKNPSPPPSPSPTVVLVAPTQTPGGPTLTPSPTVPPTITPTNSPLPPPPTDTPTPTDTPGPYEHRVEPGETCLSIAYQYGHVHPEVVSAIERINSVACRTLGAGSTILVPRPTFTATPIGADYTQTAVATAAPPMVTLDTSPRYSTQVYMVQSGDTLSSIAILNSSTLRQLCELNPLPNGLDCGGCTWESAHCCCPRPPVLSVGQQIFVPAPTPTPTLTPTFTGSETPTATPTHRAPQPVYPPDGASIAGPVRLTWLSVGVLDEGEFYLVTLRDETTGQVFSSETRQLSRDVPAEYLPTDGQARVFVWQVTVARRGSDGLSYPIGLALPEQRFVWRGWQ